jgi:CRP/FNR family transcriptional regulator, anaerobic regulatory protein
MKHKPANKCRHCSVHTDTGRFCSLLNDSEANKLSDQSRTATLKRGNSIGSEELLMWPIIAISSGVISMQHLLEDGRKTIAALFMPGDIIDMRGMSARNSGHLIALSKTEVCRMSLTAFESIIETNPNAQRVAWNNLRTQTYRAIEHAADLAKKQAMEKLASFVFECRRRQSYDIQEGLVHIPVRRVDMAEYIGMQPETVSRCFRELEQRGIIEFQNISLIRILNVPALRRIANGDKNTENLRHTSEDHFKVLSYG